MKIIKILTILLLICSCKENHLKPENREPTAVVSSLDQEAILKTINTVYNNIKVDSTQKPDFSIIKKQFVESARLGYITKDSLILKSPSEYFDGMENMLKNNPKLTYLREWEITGETKLFGTIAQRTSLYGVHANTTDSLAEKGIINFQLVKINDKWKILSMIWQAERDGQKVSDTYFD